MFVGYSKHRRAKPADAGIAKILSSVSRDRLFAYVDMVAFPRHYVAEKQANIRARDLLLKSLQKLGCSPLLLVGDYDNIVVTTGGPEDGPYLLLGAHYDS